MKDRVLREVLSRDYPSMGWEPKVNVVGMKEHLLLVEQLRQLRAAHNWAVAVLATYTGYVTETDGHGNLTIATTKCVPEPVKIK